MNTPSPRLRQLVDLSLARTISRVEMAELEDLLRTPTALDYYLHTAEIESGLRHFSLQQASKPPSASPAGSISPPSDDRRLMIASIAAVLLLSAIAAISLFPGNPKSSEESQTGGIVSEPVVAKVLQRIGPAASGPRQLRSHEEIEIPSGLIEIETLDGTRLLIEGPASFSLADASRLSLSHGRCVARIPHLRAPFQLTTPLGTISAENAEVAFEFNATSERLSVGTLEGRAFIDSPSKNRRVLVGRRDALEFTRESGYRSIAMPFKGFHRRFPTHDFAWKVPAGGFETTSIEHDLSGLIWEPGHYRVYFKWVRGADALKIHSAELLCDGQPVSRDVHSGITGDPHHTRRNAYHFDIPQEGFRKGKWTLRTRIQANPRVLHQIQLPEESLSSEGRILLADDRRLHDARKRLFATLEPEPDSQGILLFEQGSASSPSDFYGSWNYSYNGKPYTRIFRADGSAEFIEDGETKPNFERSTWVVGDGVLTLTIRDPHSGSFQSYERHLLRDRETLIFLDRPYPNASRRPPTGSR